MAWGVVRTDLLPGTNLSEN